MTPCKCLVNHALPGNSDTQVRVVGRTHLIFSGFPPRSAMKSLTSSILGCSTRPVCVASLDLG